VFAWFVHRGQRPGPGPVPADYAALFGWSQSPIDICEATSPLGGVGSRTRQALSRMQVQRPVTTLTDPAEERPLLSGTFRGII